MEGKKRVVPREVCTESSEKGNRYREVTLSVQKSAEVIVLFGKLNAAISVRLKQVFWSV